MHLKRETRRARAPHTCLRGAPCLDFSGRPVCVFLPVPEARGQLRVWGRGNPLFPWLSLESPVARSLESG